MERLTQYPESEEEWHAGGTWESIKKATLYAVFFGRTGVFMVVQDNSETEVVFGVMVYVTVFGLLGSMPVGSMKRRDVHYEASKNGGYLTRKYDEALEDHARACAGKPSVARVYVRPERDNPHE